MTALLSHVLGVWCRRVADDAGHMADAPVHAHQRLAGGGVVELAHSRAGDNAGQDGGSTVWIGRAVPAPHKNGTPPESKCEVAAVEQPLEWARCTVVPPLSAGAQCEGTTQPR